MAEYIISLAIFLLVTIVMIIIGVSQIKSENPVGFYTGEKPLRKDELSDVVAWNKKHGSTFDWNYWCIADYDVIS